MIVSEFSWQQERRVIVSDPGSAGERGESFKFMVSREGREFQSHGQQTGGKRPEKKVNSTEFNST